MPENALQHGAGAGIPMGGGFYKKITKPMRTTIRKQVLWMP
jgi:hypothetical protein